MTGQELIDWIKQHNAENTVVEVAYRDEGGLYYGTDKNIDPLIVGEKCFVCVPWSGRVRKIDSVSD